MPYDSTEAILIKLITPFPLLPTRTVSGLMIIFMLICVSLHMLYYTAIRAIKGQ